MFNVFFFLIDLINKNCKYQHCINILLKKNNCKWELYWNFIEKFNTNYKICSYVYRKICAYKKISKICKVYKNLLFWNTFLCYLAIFWTIIERCSNSY